MVIRMQEYIISDATIDTLHQYLTRAVPFGFHGQVLVAQNGEILLHEGYGWANREKQIPNTAQTAFDTGSINKVFTGIAIMQLVENGQIGLTDTLEKFFYGIPSDKKDITIEQLLQHRSGLDDYIGKHDFDPYTQEEALTKIFDTPLVSEPGKEYIYSNAGYVLMGILLENLTGQPYRDLMCNQVFQPANMQKTGWYSQRIWGEDEVATGYVKGENQKSPYEWDAPLWALLASGGLVHPLSDLFHAHEALKNNVILSEATQQQMVECELAMANQRY